MPADVIREAAHAYARADKAMVCWTLGITEHHNAVDNVLALINLALLTGHVGRWGCGCNPLRGQNNVQGGGDMGAIPNKLPGFQDIEQDHAARARIGALWGTTIQPKYGKNLTQMLHAMSRRDADLAVRHRREPGAVRRRRASCRGRARRPRSPRRPGALSHADRGVRARRAAGRRDVVRGRGHRHQQRAARAARAQGHRAAARARETSCGSSSQIAKRLGHDWGEPIGGRASGTSSASSRRISRAA